jgi:hypothetical protein
MVIFCVNGDPPGSSTIGIISASAGVVFAVNPVIFAFAILDTPCALVIHQAVNNLHFRAADNLHSLVIMTEAELLLPGLEIFLETLAKMVGQTPIILPR